MIYSVKKRTDTPETHLKGYVFNYERVGDLFAHHDSLHDVFSNVDGEYSVVYTDAKGLVACRDVNGTRPLYVYTDKTGFVGFSFERVVHDTYGEPRMFPKGSYWTSEHPDSIFSIPRYSKGTETVLYDDVIDGVINLLLHAVEKRVANKCAVVIPDGEVYSEILILVCNTRASNNDKPKMMLSTYGAVTLFEKTIESSNKTLTDDRYTYPFLDKELVSYVRRFSDYWNKDMTANLFSRLFTL